MNTRDNDDLIHAFLQQTRDQLPERSYSAIRSEIDHTPQRVVLGPWRTPLMNNFSSYVLGAAALAVIVLAAVFGFNYVVKPAPPAQSAPPTPTAVPTPSPVALAAVNKGQALQPGTYNATIPERVKYTFTVPESWVFDDLGSGRFSMYQKQSNPDQWTTALNIAGVKGVYADPCNPGDGATAVEQTVPAIVGALTSQKGLVASAPSPAQFVGANGLTFTVVSQIDDSSCAVNGTINQWRDPSDFDFPVAFPREQLWVVDMGTGNPLVVQLRSFPWTTTDEQQSAEQVVASLKFGQP